LNSHVKEIVRTMALGKTLVKRNHYHVIFLENPEKRRFSGTWGFYFIPFE